MLYYYIKLKVSNSECGVLNSATVNTIPSYMHKAGGKLYGLFYLDRSFVFFGIAPPNSCLEGISLKELDAAGLVFRALFRCGKRCTILI